jgi:hypothetical protein
LTRDQWYELDAQFSRTPERPDAKSVPGEHLKLIALLNRFGFHPMSKQESMNLAAELLAMDWREA